MSIKSLYSRIREYDFVIVLPRPHRKSISGGTKVAYNIAKVASSVGLRVMVIHLIDFTYYPSYNKKIHYKILDHLFYFFFNFMWFRDLYSRIFYSNYTLNSLRGVTVKCVKNINNIICGSIVATAWETAWYVNDYLKLHQDTIGYYLIQNYEGDDKFSDQHGKLASETYDFPLRKIVVSSKLSEHFSNKVNFILWPSFDENTFFLKKPIDSRSASVIIPLRRGTDKGAKLGIEAMKIINEKFPSLIITGYGNMDQDEIPHFVRYYRNPKNKLLAELLNSSSIFVLPSAIEGFSIPPIEAMACGCAVVSTRNGGSESYIVNGVNGILVDNQSPDDIAAAVEFLISDRELCQTIAKNGTNTAKNYNFVNFRSEVLKGFSWSSKNANQLS